MCSSTRLQRPLWGGSSPTPPESIPKRSSWLAAHLQRACGKDLPLRQPTRQGRSRESRRGGPSAPWPVPSVLCRPIGTPSHGTGIGRCREQLTANTMVLPPVLIPRTTQPANAGSPTELPPPRPSTGRRPRRTARRSAGAHRIVFEFGERAADQNLDLGRDLRTPGWPQVSKDRRNGHGADRRHKPGEPPGDEIPPGEY